jgi:hypothetical protein
MLRKQLLAEYPYLEHIPAKSTSFMKKLRFVLKNLAAIGMLFATTQSFAQTKQERKLEAFDKILVNHALTVHLRQGDKQAVYVEANTEDQDRIITEVTDGKLVIRQDTGQEKGFQAGRTVVYVTLKGLESLQAGSASSVIGDVPFKVDDFSLVVTEASTVKLDLTAGAVHVTMSSAGSATLKLNARQLSGRLSEASRLRIGGSYGKQTIETLTAGSIEKI